MFQLENWLELYQTVRRNKLRTFLTAFSVSWGIFMLVLLLGTGNGLLNGVEYQFRDAATNSIWIRPGMTSIQYKGLKPGKQIRFTNEDMRAIRAEVEGIEYSSPRYYVWDNNLTRYKNQFGNYLIRACEPQHRFIEKTVIRKGRFLNPEDLQEKRKVVVIGRKNVDALFKGEEPVGKYIRIRNIPFQVVGSYTDAGGENEEDVLYMPISTAQTCFNGINRVDHIIFTTGKANEEESEIMLQQAKQYLSERHGFDPKDERALQIWNNVREFKKITNLFRNIRIFVWIVGFGTIIAGIVGISNIMLISVKERTREIGVRKALGAEPRAIVRMILMESVTITFLSGYLGLVAGIGLLELVNYFMSQAGPAEDSMFKNPGIDIQTTFIALFILVFSGALAGFFPARRASLIQPVEALRAD